jgi:two-component system cell cycle sensor histidine kinase/response regulator CckA
LNAAPLDLNALVTDMAGMLNRLIGDDIEIVLNLAPNLSLALMDRSQLEQVVMNLVVNARDAMPGGGRVTIGTEDVELEKSLFHDAAVVEGLYVMLAVTDSGSGMSKEIQRHLFEPFFTTKEPGKGTGLGLSTSYGIIRQSNGYIWVYSEPGRGTTFKVYLPRSQHAVLGQQGHVGGHGAVTTGLETETVLLVEDEVAVRRLAVRILEGAGYRVLEAVNGDDAEQVFVRHADSIDMVVTDLIMPQCSGPEFLRRLRVRAPGVRILCTSGYTDPSVARDAGFERGVPFMQKPFTAAELLRRVRQELDRDATTIPQEVGSDTAADAFANGRNAP